MRLFPGRRDMNRGVRACQATPEWPDSSVHLESMHAPQDAVRHSAQAAGL